MLKSTTLKMTRHPARRLLQISRLSYSTAVKKHNTKQYNVGDLLGSSITSSLISKLVVYVGRYSRASRRKLPTSIARPPIRRSYGSL
jgi:hypothetical protein